MKRDRVRAFCVDFNWGNDGDFAAPGLYAGADPAEQIAWYRELGANVVQTFCVSHNGFAWYPSKIAPVTPGLRCDFLGEMAARGRAAGMKVFGYFSPGANRAWGEANPDLHHAGAGATWHIPFSETYLDYLCELVREALRHTPLDGLLIDWLWNPVPRGLPVERSMYRELVGGEYPAGGALGAEEAEAFCSRAIQRAWDRIAATARETSPGSALWLSCNRLDDPALARTTVLGEVDWLMNEHPDPDRLAGVRTRIRPQAKLIQCLCGWREHDPAGIAAKIAGETGGWYGFARPDPETTLPAEGPITGAIRAIYRGEEHPPQRLSGCPK